MRLGGNYDRKRMNEILLRLTRLLRIENALRLLKLPVELSLDE